MSRPTLPELARLTAYDANYVAARYVLRWYADSKGWTDEAFRARWDGTGRAPCWGGGMNKTRPTDPRLTP